MATFSKKAYESIAGVLRKVSAALDEAEDQDGACAIIDVATELSALFISDNPNFDRSRFLRACGLEG